MLSPLPSWHCAGRAQANGGRRDPSGPQSALGATVVSGIRQHGYRAYEAEDLEGNRWTFAQARPTM